MLSVLVLLLVVAAASFAYRAFWGNVLLCVLCVAAMVLVGVLVGGMGGSV